MRKVKDLKIKLECLIIVLGITSGMLSVNICNFIDCGRFPNKEINTSATVSELWSYETGDWVISSPALGDVDGDGNLEVVIGSHDDNLYAINGENGILLWKRWMVYSISSSPALGDVDDDGDLEVIVGCKDGKVYALYGENGTVLWSNQIQPYGIDLYSSPSLGDLDGDGKLEVAIGSLVGGTYVLNGEDGSIEWFYDTGRTESSPALGDIDGDGKLEVVIGSYDGTIYALNGEDGTLVWSFAMSTYYYFDSPSLGDIDGDGMLEVIIGCYPNVYALNGEDGSILWQILGVYYAGAGANPAIADLDGDGKFEVVIKSNDQIHTLNGEDGSLLWSSDSSYCIAGRSAPALGDVDGDGKLEIIVGSSDQNVYALNSENGDLVWNFKTGNFESEVWSSPSLGDLDGDGKLEVVVGSLNGKIYALQPSPSGEEIMWQGFAGENFHRTRALSYFLDYRPDLAIFQEDVTFVKEENGKAYIQVNITNLGASYDNNVIVRLFDEFEGSITQIGLDQIIPGISKMELKTISVGWTPALLHNITIIIDPDNLIEEVDKNNNIVKKGTGGNSPIIGNVWSDHGNWTDPSTLGTFLLPIRLNNTFYVEIIDLDGDIEYVEIIINEEIYDGSPSEEQNIWIFNYNMGELKALPKMNNLSIIAYDKLNYSSEQRNIHIKALEAPTWLTQIIGFIPEDPFEFPSNPMINSMDVDTNLGTITIGFLFPPQKPQKAENTLPNHSVPNPGGQQAGTEYEITVSFRFNWNTGKASIYGKGKYDFNLFGIKTTVSISVNGNITSWNSVELEFTLGCILKFPILKGPNFENKICTVKIGVDAEIRITVKMIMAIVENVLNWYIFNFIINGYIIGYLEAKIDLGWVKASFKAQVRAGIKFNVGYDFQNEKPLMSLTGSLGIIWSVKVKVWFFKFTYRGSHEYTFEVFSPQEVNQTTEEEPWIYSKNATNTMDSRPRVATDGKGNATMVWTKNRLENDRIYTDICYAFWDGDQWGEEDYITFDNNADFDPTLAYDSNGNIIAVWSRVTGNIDEESVEDPIEVSKTQEIVYSIWDGNTWSSPQLITSNEYADGNAVVSAGLNGEAIVAWVGDQDSNFTTAEDIEIYYSHWDGNQWSYEEKLTDNYYMDYSASLAHDTNGNALICWIQDNDGNISSTDDRFLLYSQWNGNGWDTPNLITTHEGNKESPSVTYDLDNNCLITWVGAYENKTRLYFSLWNKTTSQWSIPEIVYEDDFFIYHPAINVAPDNRAVIVWRGFEDDAAERSYYLSHNTTKTYFDGEICYAVKDLNRINSNWSDVKYLTSDNKTDWMASAVIIRGHSNDLLLVWDKAGNVSKLVHELKPDLYINTSDITFSNKYPNEGDEINITATVYNIGDYEARNVLVRFYNGDPLNGGVLITEEIIEYLDYDEKYNVTILWTAKLGTNSIYVIVDANNSISEIDETNNIAYNIIDILPDLVITAIFWEENPSEGEEVSITARVYNQGGTAAKKIFVQFYFNGTSIGDAIIDSLTRYSYASASIPWIATRGFNNISVMIDPDFQIMEWNETNNNASTIISVLPDLEVSRFVISKRVISLGEDILISGEIQNVGFAGADDIIVELFDGNPFIDGVLIGAMRITLNKTEKYQISINWMPKLGVHRIFVVIDKLNLIPESNEKNNLLYEEFIVISLPNLRVLEPAIIITEDLLVINTPVENIGDATATGIIVELFDGNPLGNGIFLDSQIIPYINAGNTEVVSLYLYEAPINDDLYIIVDPQNIIKESSESNNQFIIHYPDLPLIDAGPDREAYEGSIVVFSASVFGGNLEDFIFRWDFGDVNTGENYTVNHQYSDNGVYLVSLNVTGPNYYATDHLTVTIFNVDPSVNAGFDQLVNEDEIVYLSGTFEDPGLNDTHSIEWDFGDGLSNSGTLNPIHLYPDNGIYTVTLTITDDDGGIGTDTILISVLNVIPNADAGPDQIVLDNQIAIFDGSNSWDTPSDLPTLDYLWDFGDGTYESGVIVSHCFSDLGMYTVTLTVIDDDGASDTDTCMINHEDDDVTPPELSNLVISVNIHEVNISLKVSDESGIAYFGILINDTLIQPIDQIQTEDIYTFILKNQWIMNPNNYELEIMVTDADDDLPDDSLTSWIFGSFEITLKETYEYVSWQIGELKKYIAENVCFRFSQPLNRKLSQAQERLQEAIILVDCGEITCSLCHCSIAQIYLQISEHKTKIFNRNGKINDINADYIIHACHEIRNNIVILKGASVGTGQAYDIALVETELLDLNDFIEEQIQGRYLHHIISCSVGLLELALFKISKGCDTEWILEHVKHKLERIISKINFFLEKGRISEDLANCLIERLYKIIEDIEQIN